MSNLPFVQIYKDPILERFCIVENLFLIFVYSIKYISEFRKYISECIFYNKFLDS